MHIFMRPVEAKDASMLSSWFNDPAINRSMSTIYRCRTHSPDSVRKDILAIDPEYERLFVALVEEDGKEVLIGHGGIDDIDFDDLRGELFFLIGDRSYQGRGLGLRFAELLIDHAFVSLGLHSLFASVMADNLPSLAVLEKCGFRRIGVGRDYNRVDGAYVDEVFFDMTADDFLSRKKMKE